jgi:uncharacterized membrane protein
MMKKIRTMAALVLGIVIFLLGIYLMTEVWHIEGWKFVLLMIVYGFGLMFMASAMESD